MTLATLLHWLQLHAIIPMFAIFAAIVAATYWPGRKRAIERRGMVPLDDDR
ncbi:MAG TPA: CcoQ/FixQ family Cbb3-type cytochrome c oxidase assembly chaperone [Acetobacteraceae bacterium]|nr:CcoQ/FixQ family Cbb3-type cytochrome c oxidase assembly chaperone [Acetobacteraceae bacterium]